MSEASEDIVDLHGFALEQLPNAPLGRRVRLLRTLAQIIGSADLAARLRAEADDLAAIEQRHQQLLLDLRGGLS